MSRLIDADDLIEYIKIWEIGNSISSDQKEFIDCVNRQLTVFDVDKVISELKRDTFVESECILSDVHQGYNAGLNRAIEIVKGGGVE
jgi:hypothetical protein|nr:MAG TPA: hypothetical protein [Caudoviricetes sp.]